MRTYYSLLIIMIISLLISGCGEEGGPPPETSTYGNVIYGPTRGITSICSSGEAKYTDVNGSFTCNVGDNVSFYIGSIPVATLDAKNGNTTPYEFFPNDNIAALNYVRLLEALNNSKQRDTYGPIDINNALALSLPIDTDFHSPSFATEVEEVLHVTLISLTQAQENLNRAMLGEGEEIPDGSHIPVADAGDDKNITNFDITLDGSKSFDLDQDALTFIWSIISTPNNTSITLSDPTAINPTFSTDVLGTYEFALTVNDGTVNSKEDNVVINILAQNSIPTSNAGADQSVATGSSVNLNGSNSTDIDGDTLTYTWTFNSQPSGSTATLSDATIINPIFQADVDGIYIIDLIVNDGNVDSVLDSVKITASTTVVANSTPIANAGADQNVKTLSVVTLNAGASSDADGDTLSYVWSVVSIPTGSTSQLSSSTVSSPTFSADKNGTYTFELIVNDGTVSSNTDSVTIIATSSNVAPIANAGNNQNVNTLALVGLDASASSDADGDTLTYNWSLTSRPGGSGANLSSVTSSSPTFTADVAGLYTFDLVVNDGTLDSATASVSVSATTPNTAPIANAGADQYVITTAGVTLEGNASSDADLNPLTYAWTMTTVPGGSGATLVNPTTNNPTFTADLDGLYVIELVVNDGFTNSAVDSISVTSTAANSAPVANAGNDQNVSTGTIISLSGSASSDVDFDVLTYAWSINTNPGTGNTFSNAAIVNPSFNLDVTGTYVFDLIVNDGNLSSVADSITIITSVVNNIPVANAGSNQNVANGNLVTLDASSSSDVDGDSLTYAWTITSQPGAVTLSSTTVTNPTFTPIVDGNYTIELIVHDGTDFSSADSVIIIVNTANSAPNADAGIDQFVATSSVVTLDASGSNDANSDSLTYLWSVTSKPSGTTVTFSDATAVNPTFSAYLDGEYILNLVVNDGTVDSVADSITVTASTGNSAPVANAGIDQNVANGNLVTLDANASSDADSDALTYAWTITSQPGAITLSNGAISNPTFTPVVDGAYIFQLIVNDGTINSLSDTVTVTVSTANSAPVANAGSDAVAYVNVGFTLDGNASSDANLDPLNYAWSIFSKPGGSTTASFSNAAIVNPNFTADVSGSYVLQLIVDDSNLSSAADKVTLTVIAVELTKQTLQTYNEESGDDGFYQAGVAPSYSLSSNVVTDSVTGLMWQDDNPTFYNPIAGNFAESYCSGLSLSGYSDWRLPTIYEMLDIADRSTYAPSINTSFFRTMNNFRFFWTSSMANTSERMLVDYYNADELYNSNLQAYPVRCVRGNSSNTLIVRDDANNVVIDYKRKLEWQDNVNPAAVNWASAISYCEALSFNGSTNWRLPNINELMSVIDFDNTSGVYNNIFTINPDNAWSSTTNTQSISQAYSIYNASGNFYSNKPFMSADQVKTSTTLNPKCVRTLP